MLRIFLWRLIYHFLCFLKLVGAKGGTTHYFAYGGNLDPEVLKKRNIWPKSRKEFILDNYKLTFNHATPFKDLAMASIEESPGSKVPGVIYELNKIDTLRLDCMEAHIVFNRYGKTFVRTSENAKIFFYKTNRPRSGLSPTRAYLDKILNGYSLLNQVDGDFLEDLKKTPTIPGFVAKETPEFLIQNYETCGDRLKPLLVWYDRKCVSVFASLIFKPSFFEKFYRGP